MASTTAEAAGAAPLPVQAVEEMLDFLAHESFRVAGREDQWHPPRMRYRKDVASKLVTKALAGQQELVDRYHAARKEEQEAAELGVGEGSADGAATAAASPKATGRYGATADDTDAAEAAVSTLADIAATSGLLDLGVAGADPLDATEGDVLGIGAAPEGPTAGDTDAAAEGGAFLSSSDDDNDNDCAGVGDTAGPPVEEDRAVAAMRALTAGSAAAVGGGLSKEAAAALAAARRGAAREEMARARAARLDVGGDGASAPGAVPPSDGTPKAPTSMTYDEFMAAGAVGRVPRRGEGLTRALTRDEESRMAEDGYVISGRKNPVAQKRLEATQRAMHQLQADKRKVELAAESHRRRDQEALESFKRTTTQPAAAPPPGEGEGQGGAVSK